MTSRTISGTVKQTGLTAAQWLWIGLQAAAAAILAVLVVQAVILAVWPEFVNFKPLESYARSALFTFIPVIGATGVLAWLVRTQVQPVKKFIWISAGFLFLSFIPDYIVPVPGRNLASSSAAAFLHLVAGLVTVGVLVFGYRRALRQRQGR